MADPTTLVNPPRRRPRKGGIRAVANIETLERAFASESVEWVNLECALPEDAPGLCWGAEVPDGEKDRYGFQIHGTAPIFALFGGAECYLDGVDTYEAEARAILANGADRVIEGKLAAYLDSESTPGAPSATWTAGIAAAETAADAGYIGQPVLVMNRGDVVAAVTEGALESPDASNGAVFTANGTPVLSTSAVPAGTIYATGDITLYESVVVATAAADFRSNRQLAIAEQAFTFGIDCAYVEAYLVDTTP